MTGFIKLNGGAVTRVDDEDWGRLTACEMFWNSRNGYVYLKVSGRRVALHRYLMQPSGSLLVDHINGDKLDNRKSNLRLCTKAQNMQNSKKKQTKRRSSLYKGVNKNTGCSTYTAKLGRQYLGSFPNEVEAAMAYDRAARAAYGEFARLNFPDLLQK